MSFRLFLFCFILKYLYVFAGKLFAIKILFILTNFFVLAKPKLLDFQQQIQLVPNISYILQCLEITGTSESLTFFWTKDGHRLLPSDNLKIDTSQKSSVITFVKLHPQNTGSYECKVKNSQDESDFTSTKLLVKGLFVSKTCCCVMVQFADKTWRFNQSKIGLNENLCVLKLKEARLYYFVCLISLILRCHITVSTDPLGQIRVFVHIKMFGAKLTLLLTLTVCHLLTAFCIADKGPRINRNFVPNVSPSENTFQLFSCAVISGLKPFAFEWTFNRKPLKANSNIKIENSENFSFLSIQSVKQSNSGNYTCLAKNAVGSDFILFNLNVKGNY